MLFWSFGFISLGSVYVLFAVKFGLGLVGYVLLIVLFRQAKWLTFIMPSSFRRRLPSWLLR